MTIEQARYIVEVAQCGTFQKASQSLFVSQSAISQAISSIEKDLGSPIFQRTRNGCNLTTFGTEVYNLCQQIVSSVEAVNSFSIKVNADVSGKLVINMANYGLYSYIPQLVSMFRKKYPCVIVEINECNYTEMLASLDDGTCDFSVAILLGKTYELLTETYKCYNLSESYLSVGVSSKSKLTKWSALTPGHLKGNHWVLSNESFADDLTDVIPSFSKSDVLFYSNNINLIHSAITKDLAIGVFTDLTPHYNKLLFREDIMALPLVVNGRRPTSYFAAIFSKTKAMSPQAEDFFDMWVRYAQFAPHL